MSDAGIAATVASKVPFGQLCQLFERMKRAKTNAVRKEEFQNFVSKWRELHEKLHEKVVGTSTSDSFYPALRLILPQLDRERPSYGVKETLLAKLYIEVLGLSRTNPDAKKLLEFKNPKTNKTSTGDFAEIAFQHVLSKRCTTHGSMTIQQINEHLDKIALYNNEKNKPQVQKMLMSVIQRTSAAEQKWLIRMLLKDTQIKLGQSAILAEYHPDAEELFNVTTNLRQVCVKLRDPAMRLSDVEIELFQPFRPMLALNAQLNEVEMLMDRGKFRLEIKYDGERSQLHKNELQYKYFSRNGREYSTVFGEGPYAGSLTPFVHDLFSPFVKSCILDGEMMGYDPDMKLFMQKGGKFDIKHVTEDSDLQPCFVAFDLLYLNGENLTSRPQSERMQKMQDVFEPVEGRIQLTEWKEAGTNQEVLDFLNEAIDRREEGIIVKHPHAPYAPNKRKGSGWFKIKPEYVGGVVDDMDLVIVGGKFGMGRHGSLINKFMLAVRDGDGAGAIYKSLSMVGSGYTDKELLEITNALKPHLQVFEKRQPPKWLLLGKEKPEVIVHPDNSVVVQVRATEITESSAYATGCTLRFPRIVSTRKDKTVADAMDVTQLKNLREMAEGKLAARHATLTSEPSPKKRKVRLAPQAVISTKFQGADLSLVQQTSSSFEGKEFCVMTGTDGNSKASLETAIASHGGSIVQNPTLTTLVVVAKDEKNIRVRNIIKGRKYDVVRVSWLVQCLDQSAIVPFQLSDMLFTSSQTQKAFAAQFDKYGDEYAEEVTVEQLRETFSKVTDGDVAACFLQSGAGGRLHASQSFVNAVSERYPSAGFHDLPTSLFQGFQFYINDKLIINDASTSSGSTRCKMIKALLQFYGGIVSDAITNKTTHVITLNDDPGCGEVSQVAAIRRENDRKFHIVADRWVIDSVDSSTLQQEQRYAV